MNDATTDAHWTELLDGMSAMVELLNRAGERHWSDWILRDRESVSMGDREGVRHLLSAFGGMGSLNDVLIRTLDGRALSSEDATARTSEFDRLKERVWQLAKQLAVDVEP